MILLRELIPKYKYVCFTFFNEGDCSANLNEIFRNIKGNGCLIG